MELDTKQKVLLSFYTEYQKDLPDMENNITPEVLGIDYKRFSIALEKLQSEGLIKEVVFQYGGNDPAPLMSWWDKAKMTREGINYIESKMAIEPTLTGLEKVKEVSHKAGIWGFEQIKELAAKVIAEIINKTVGL